MRHSFTRRAALAAMAGMALFRAAASVAAPAGKFRAIEVDVSPVRAKGDQSSADWLAEDLPALLQKAFANDLAPGDRGAPVLVARVDSISYGTSSGGGAGAFTTAAHDFIEGAAVVKSGAASATYPLMTSTDVGAELIDAVNGQRLRALALAGVFARWLPGQMGL